MGDFSGAFFSNRPLPAKALGAFARAAVPDGILSGCDLSYTGSTLTVAAGMMIACGRVFSLPEAKSLSLTGATSGYARVIVQIDLAGTSSKTEFEQASFVTQYATTADGFAALTQDDVNAGGTVYQMELCQAALSASGITSVTGMVRTSLAESGRMPIGAIFLSVSEESPAAFYGGTWERIKDRFLLAAGDSYTAGATGGAATHTLTENEMPKHRHYLAGKEIPYWNYSSGSSANYSGVSYSHSSEPWTSYTGGGKAHNNMPPYLTVYAWKRIA